MYIENKILKKYACKNWSIIITKTEIIANCTIIRTLSGVTLRKKETIKEENPVTKETDSPIVIATLRRLVTAKAEQIPKIATSTWLLRQSCSVK